MSKNAQAKQERKALRFELKAMDDAGKFEGYLATFEDRDSYGDIIKAGAFKKTIRENKSNGWPLLWQHYRDEPIGIISEAIEDSKGLLIKGQLALEVQKATEARALMQIGAVTGLSIGYIPVKWTHEKDETSGVTSRILKEIALKEGSAVTFPAMDRARLTGVKGEAVDMTEIETALIDAGMTPDQTKQTLEFISTEVSPQEAEPGDHSETPAGSEKGEPDATEEKEAIHSIQQLTEQLRS